VTDSKGKESSFRISAALFLVIRTSLYVDSSALSLQVWEHVCLPISKENEEGICDSMIEGIKSSLSNYETTIEEDVKILGEGLCFFGSARSCLSIPATCHPVT
jgi:hypothetical protein